MSLQAEQNANQADPPDSSNQRPLPNPNNIFNYDNELDGNGPVTDDVIHRHKKNYCQYAFIHTLILTLLSSQLTDQWEEFLSLGELDRESFSFVIINMLIYLLHVSHYCLCYVIVSGQNYKCLGSVGTWITIASILTAIWGLWAVTRENFVLLID